MGTIDKMTGYTVTLKIIRVGKGTLKFAHSETAPTDNDLQDAINTLAEVAAKEVAGIKVTLPKTKKRDGQYSKKDEQSGSPVFSMRDAKKKHLVTNFIVAPPIGKMARKVELGWGGSLGLQYRDYVVIGIEGAAMQFNSKAVVSGKYVHMPLYVTLGVNLKFKDFVCFIPYVSGGFAWNWSQNIAPDRKWSIPWSNDLQKTLGNHGLASVFNGVMKTGLAVEIHPGSVVSITLGGYYGLVFNNSNHAIQYAYSGVSAGLNLRF